MIKGRFRYGAVGVAAILMAGPAWAKPPVKSFCGNGAVEANKGEECDGADLE